MPFQKKKILEISNKKLRKISASFTKAHHKTNFFSQSNHIVRLEWNDKKMQPLSFKCLEVHNRHMDPGEQKILDSHDGLQRYLLSTAGPSARQGWWAGIG